MAVAIPVRTRFQCAVPVPRLRSGRPGACRRAGPRRFFAKFLEDGGRDDDVAETETHFSSTGGLARIGAAEDYIFHLVATKALGTLLAKHPRERVGHVALTAAVGSDDGRNATVECQLGPIREGLKA